jgi:hypothetical protein
MNARDLLNYRNDRNFFFKARPEELSTASVSRMQANSLARRESYKQNQSADVPFEAESIGSGNIVST